MDVFIYRKEITDLIEINNMAMHQQCSALKIKNYIANSAHAVKNRKDYEFSGNTFHTAKIVLQSIKSIIDIHSSYICGSPVSITGDKEIAKMVQSIYKRGFFSKSDYEIAKNIYTYGNAYEHLYKQDGKIKSRVIANTNSFPIYDENGKYVRFVEKWCYNPITDDTFERVYTEKEVLEYRNGTLIGRYRNSSNLPIHYTSGNYDNSNVFGVGIVPDLMVILDNIEELLSKVSDAVTNLSCRPIGIVTGQRLDESANSDIVGATINLDDGGTFSWGTATLDTPAIKILLDSLISQYFQIAQIPSVLYGGQSQISNCSQTSLELLFSNTHSLAQRVSYSLLEGFGTRLEYISSMLNMDVTDVNITFNYSKIVDNKAMMEGMEIQANLGCLSKESIIRNSPWVCDVDRELELIQSESDVMSTNKVSHDKLDNNQVDEDKVVTGE